MKWSKPSDPFVLHRLQLLTFWAWIICIKIFGFSLSTSAPRKPPEDLGARTERGELCPAPVPSAPVWPGLGVNQVLRVTLRCAVEVAVVVVRVAFIWLVVAVVTTPLVIVTGVQTVPVAWHWYQIVDGLAPAPAVRRRRVGEGAGAAQQDPTEENIANQRHWHCVCVSDATSIQLSTSIVYRLWSVWIFTRLRLEFSECDLTSQVQRAAPNKLWPHEWKRC